MATGAELIVTLLEDHRVEVVFGLPGVHNLALWEALRASSMRLVGVRHEQAAAYAADGYARATGRLGVALTTTGPGAANTLGAVGEAWASRSPVLVIATDIASTLRDPGAYRGVLHECTDQAAMFAPVTKSTHRALAAEQFGAAVAQAFESVMEEPYRPVYLEIATDLLGARVTPEPLPAGGVRTVVAGADVDAAAEALGAAERPLLWIG
ncbi:MAG TPA: thiamine pyrophosphate-binding protein, partial [Solirubrobacteraceae bacterium]|nr:thiamine pyrophosphate-binding protein [Solirubrobacteraceae bacterium]